jgi:glutamate-1-semialdehyde 2,1-aminomutase
MKTDKSQKIYELAQKVTPGGVNSPVRAFKSVGGTPRLMKRGEGSLIYDIDDNRYLDFCCSWGPLILGHNDPDVIRAIKKQLDKGLTFGTSTEIEYRLADFIVRHLAPVESIRFVSSGTEAVMSAIRVARGFTGRDLILKFEGCYHGHSDHLLAKAGSGLATLGQPSSAGVPETITRHTAVLPLGNEDALDNFLKQQGNKLAAAIIEGIPANNGLLIQSHEYMQKLRTLTEKYGALFILDEVITGFRLGLGGAAAYYGITPDLITYGKIIGGGMPVGAFGGRTDVMNKLAPIGPVYQAGTLSGNPLAMTAGLATLQKLADGKIYDDLEKKTRRFMARFASCLDSDAIQISGIASIFWILFQKILPHSSSEIDIDGINFYNRVYHKILDSGIYLPPSGYEVCFISAAHTDENLQQAAEMLASIINEEISRQ